MTMSSIVKLNDDNSTTPLQQEARIEIQPGKISVKDESLHSDQKKIAEPPDGGWGWAVVAGGQLTLAFVAMTGPCFGVLFSRPLLDMGASSTTVAWIFNISQLFNHWSGIFGGQLVKAFGFRKTAITAGLLTALSMLLSAFVTSPEMFYFSFSILGGTGAGIGITIPFLIVPRYFKRLLGRAIALMIMGINVGQIFGPSIVAYLQREFGFKGATMIISGLFLHIVVGALVFHPVEWHQKKDREFKHPLVSISDKEKSENELSIKNKDIRNIDNDCSARSKEVISPDTINIKLQNKDNNVKITTSGMRSSEKDTKDPPTKLSTFVGVLRDSLLALKILKNPIAAIICFGGALVFNGFFNFYVFLPFAIQARGLPLEIAAYCISASAAFNLCTRVVLSVIVDKPWFNKTYSYIFGNCAIVTCAAVFPWLTSMVGMIVVMVFWGIGLSLNVSLHNLLMIQYLGVENLPTVLSASKFINGLIFISVGPLIGVVRDVTNNYTIAINVLAGTMFLSLILWSFMPMALSYEKKKKELRREVR